MDNPHAWRNWHVRFRQHLDDYKAEHGLVDAEVAERIGVSRAAITHWKAGRRTPELDNFFAACEAMKADPEYILFGRQVQAPSLIASRLAKLPEAAREAVMMALEGAEARELARKKSLVS